MGFSKKVKKAFKKVASAIISVAKSVVEVVAKAVVLIVKTVMKIEGEIYSIARDITETLNIGPPFIRNFVTRLTNAVYDGLMSFSKLKVSLALLAMGAATNNREMRAEGRLYLMEAALYFTRMMSRIPNWLVMIVMVFLSIFCAPVALIMMAAFAAAYALVTFELPKVQDDPERMIRFLIVMRQQGLLDKASSDLLDIYLSQRGLTKDNPSHDVIHHDWGVNPEFEEVDIGAVFDAIRDAISKPPPTGDSPFVPGNTRPEPVVKESDDRSLVFLFAAAVATLFLIGRN